MKTKQSVQNNTFDQRIQRFAQYLLLLRKIQDKKGSEFIAAMGKLSLQELNVLNIIGDNDPCIMRDIAKQAVLSLSSITVIVDKLVRAKFVKRLRNEEDRRIVYATLTPEGYKIYGAQIQHMHEVLRRMLEGLTDEEQESLLMILQKIIQKLG